MLDVCVIIINIDLHFYGMALQAVHAYFSH